jgi:hypothetical protein
MMLVALVVEGLAATCLWGNSLVFDTFEVAIYHSEVNYTTVG